MQDKNKKKELLKEAFKNEKDIRDTIKEKSNEFQSKLDPQIKNIVDDIYSFEGMTKQMTEMGLDLEKLPLGKLNADKIKRGHQILKEIQRLLVTNKNADKILPLTNDFYTTIPHNFGMKKPPVIDHLLRVKEKTRMLEQLQDILSLQSVYLKK
tara:strand:- start:728 stop:1186 length:459 start_codon:yes stop_codon:yes gene_type:complete